MITLLIHNYRKKVGGGNISHIPLIQCHYGANGDTDYKDIRFYWGQLCHEFLMVEYIEDMCMPVVHMFLIHRHV